MEPVTHVEAERLADTLRDKVLARTGLTAETLQCPREKSDMTPCIARDGGTAACLSSEHGTGRGTPICVGCGHAVRVLLAKEESR